MNALLTYLTGSALMLVLLWIGFRLLFYAQKTLRVNRVLLTVILAFSVTAPLLLSPVRLPVPERLPDLAGLMSVRDAVSEASVPAGQGGQEGVRLESVLTWAYAAGAVAVLFVRVLLPLLSVALLLRRGRVSVYVAGGRRIRVAIVPGAAPMSWMGIVILPSGKEFGDDSCVLRHELAHVLPFPTCFCACSGSIRRHGCCSGIWSRTASSRLMTLCSVPGWTGAAIRWSLWAGLRTAGHFRWPVCSATAVCSAGYG